MINSLASTRENTDIKLLFLYRLGVLLFSIIMTLQGQIRGALLDQDWLVILCYGAFQVLVPLFFIAAIKARAFYLFAFADILIGCLLVAYTGGLSSPLLTCLFISVFSLHFLYGLRGLIGAIATLALGQVAIFFSGGLIDGPIWLDWKLLYIPTTLLTIVIVYIIPSILVKRYYYLSYTNGSLKDRLQGVDSLNTRLLVLFEMMGKLSYEAGLNQNMDKIHLVAKEVFDCQRACIYLIVAGKHYSYGDTSREEKAEIYKLIDEISKKDEGKRAGKREDIKGYEPATLLEARKDSMMVPIISAAKLDGVICLYNLKSKPMTSREAILITVITNMVSSYLRNLEYLESISYKRDTSVKINQLDSGKAVKGILDKRIVSHNL